MLKFKNGEVEAEFFNYDLVQANIRSMTVEVAAYAQTRFGKDTVVTDVIRPDEIAKPESPHRVNPKCRAVDIRAHFDNFNVQELRDIESMVKIEFERPDGISPILLHGNSADFHIHLQSQKEE